MFVCSYLMYNTEYNLRVYVDYIPTMGEPIKLINSIISLREINAKDFLLN